MSNFCFDIAFNLCEYLSLQYYLDEAFLHFIFNILHYVLLSKKNQLGIRSALKYFYFYIF